MYERTWQEPRRAAMLDEMEGRIRAYEAQVMPATPGALPEAPRLNRPPRPSR